MQIERQSRQSLEGDERIARLPLALFFAVSVGGTVDAPVVAYIGWTRTDFEQPYPGTAIWRATLERFLASPATDHLADRIVRAAAKASLERFTSLDRWLQWYDRERGRNWRSRFG